MNWLDGIDDDSGYDPTKRERLRNSMVGKARQQAKEDEVSRALGVWLSSVHPVHARYRMDGGFIDTVKTRLLPVAIDEVNDFIMQPQGFLILQGDTGLGKTSLAVAMVTEMIQDGVVNEAKLVLGSTMLNSFSQYNAFDGKQNNPVQEYSDPQLLIIDDLGVGNERMTPLQEQQLSTVIDNRWGDDDKFTIITTNMALRGSAGDGLGLDTYLNRAAWDRVSDKVNVAQFTGKSMRGQD